MPRVLKIVFLLLLLGAIAVGAYGAIRFNTSKNSAKTQDTVGYMQKEIPSLYALLVQVDEASGDRRVLECGPTGCSPKNPPKSEGTNPLSDGSNWYRYAERTEKDATKATVLEKVDTEGNVQTITEENPLVKPRAMMLSTDGTKIAYFLDNIHDNSGLTELWVYDSNEGGTKVIAEKLHRPDIASSVRWNASSRVAWFLHDGTKKELLTASVTGSAAMPRFAGVDWSAHTKAADSGVMDINDDASLIAFAEPTYAGFSKLFVARGDEAALGKSVKGNVVFVRWMQEGGLLYAVQDGKNLSFWMANTKKEWPITRMDAVFESAHSAGAGNVATFVASPRAGERHLYVLDIATGLIKDETVIPNFPGKTYLVQTREAAPTSVVAGITTGIPDDQLVAFIEGNMPAIAQMQDAKARRILITDVPNTVFVDYTAKGAEQRILLLVSDIVNPEWKVIASYKTMNGLWKRSDTTGNKDPNAVRLYEWEDSLSQWILKQSY